MAHLWEVTKRRYKHDINFLIQPNYSASMSWVLSLSSQNLKEDHSEPQIVTDWLYLASSAHLPSASFRGAMKYYLER